MTDTPICSCGLRIPVRSSVVRGNFRVQYRWCPDCHETARTVIPATIATRQHRKGCETQSEASDEQSQQDRIEA